MTPQAKNLRQLVTEATGLGVSSWRCRTETSPVRGGREYGNAHLLPMGRAAREALAANAEAISRSGDCTVYILFIDGSQVFAWATSEWAKGGRVIKITS